MKKDKLIVLVGESGSGKTTLCKELASRNYEIIQSYTTRPPRYTGEYGHIFVNDKPSDMTGIVAFTYFDKNYYWALHDQYIGKGNVVYTLDPEETFKIKDVALVDTCIFYLKADIELRKKRLMQRCTNDSQAVTKEDLYKIAMRLINDIDKFRIVKADYIIDASIPTKEIADIVERLICD